MKLYDLTHGEAVIMETGKLVGLKTGTYRIDGEMVTLVYRHFNQHAEYLIAQDSIVELFTEGGINKFRRFGSIVITEDEYKGMRHDLRAPYLDEDSVLIYPNLDTEFSVRHRLDELESNYEAFTRKDKDTYTVVEFATVASATDTGSRYIETPLCLGRTRFGTGGFFKVQKSWIQKNEWGLLVNEFSPEFLLDNPTHSNIHYAKIDGEFLFTNFMSKSADNFVIVNTLEEAQEIERKIRTQIRERVLVFVNKSREVPDAFAKELLESIEFALKQVQHIDSKVKTRRERANAINTLNELTNKLSEFIAYGK